MVEYSSNLKTKLAIVERLVGPRQKRTESSSSAKKKKTDKEGVLISNENNRLGTTFLSEHNPNFNVEHTNLRNEAESIGLIL